MTNGYEIAAASVMLHRERLVEIVPELEAAGVRCLEVWAPAREHFNSRDPDEVRLLAQRLREHDVKAHSLHGHYGGEAALDQAAASARRRALDSARRDLDVAAELRAPFVVFHPGSEWETVADHLDAIQRAVDSFGELAEVAAQRNVALAIENPCGRPEVGHRVEELVAIVDRVASPACVACLDTGHALLRPNDLVAFTRVLGRRTATIHWHDNDAEADQHLFPGEGKGDWASFLAELRRIGYRAPITLEAGARESVDALAELVRKAEEMAAGDCDTE